jgi:hypothetical protein
MRKPEGASLIELVRFSENPVEGQVDAGTLANRRKTGGLLQHEVDCK